MEAVLYSTFRNHLKDYNVLVWIFIDHRQRLKFIIYLLHVVLSKSEWDSIQETLRIAQNKELSDKVLRGMAQVRAGSTQVHVIEE
ncbi:Prevent host death family protein [Streptococcus pneumoniae]|nr:Prevent host death family protein [Streptococcus pneumoniae]